MMGMYTLITYDWSLYFLTSFSSTPSGITCLYWKLYPSTCAKLNVNSHQGWYIRSPPAYALPRLCGSPPHRCQAPFPGRIWQQDIHHAIKTPTDRGFVDDIWSSIVSWVVDLTCENVGRIKTWNYILYTIPSLLDSRFFPFGKAWCSCCSFWQMRSYESERVHSSGKSIHATQHNYEWKNCAQHRSH